MIKPLLSVALGVFFSLGVARAQQPPAAPSAPKLIQAFKVEKTSVKNFAAELTRVSGFLIVADSSVANSIITLQSSGGTLESVLQQIIAALPKGSLVKKTHMPSAAADSKTPNPEVVSVLIQVNEALAAPMNPGIKPDPDAVVVQGRVIPKDKANEVLSALDMKPVYLLTNPQSKGPANSFARLQADLMSAWQNMTPEQRKEATERQWNDFVNMDPNARKAYMQQMMEQATGLMAKIQQLPKGELEGLFGGLFPPGALGGRGN